MTIGKGNLNIEQFGLYSIIKERRYPNPKHIELEDLDDSRSKVIYDGHFTIGIYDFIRHTFVD